MQYRYSATRIIQFARAPVVGQVKTRLIAELGEQRACDIHCQLTSHTLAALVSAGLAEVELYTDNVEDNFIAMLASRHQVAVRLQQGGSLGEKMKNAIGETLDICSIEKVVIVGSDCPTIDNHYLSLAIEALESGCDLVLGPAADGGYVLIGVNAVYQELFENIEWGGETVLQATLNSANVLGLDVELLPVLADVDRPEDVYLLGELGVR